MTRAPVLLAALLLAASCGDEAGRNDEAAPVATRTTSPETANTVHDTMRRDTNTHSEVVGDTTTTSGPGAALLVAVRAGRHKSFSRIVFEFSGSLPAYQVQWQPPPITQCGSGEVVELPGDAWLVMRFSPANAHSEAGAPTAPREREIVGANLKRIKQICDFEAVVVWVAAVAGRQPWRVLELHAPERLIIDLDEPN